MFLNGEGLRTIVNWTSPFLFLKKHTFVNSEKHTPKIRIIDPGIVL